MKWLSAAFVQLKTPPKLTRITSSQSVGSMLKISASREMPALLTRMCRPPSSSTVCAMIASASA